MLAQDEEPLFSAERSYAYAAGSKSISRKAGLTSLRPSAGTSPAIPRPVPTPTLKGSEMRPSATRSYAQVAKTPTTNPTPKTLTPAIKSAAPPAPLIPALTSVQNPSKAMGRYKVQQQALATPQPLATEAEANATSAPFLPVRNPRRKANKAQLERTVAFKADARTHEEPYSKLVLEWMARDPPRALEYEEAGVPSNLQAYDHRMKMEVVKTMRRFRDPRVLKWVDDIPDEASWEVNVWGSEDGRFASHISEPGV